METCVACGAPLPADARFCPACGAGVAARLHPSEERKVATVLFADLVGSTALGEQDPERTRAVLDRFYDAMASEVTSAGGTVEKFAGDAVMAAFGVPAAHEDHAERALHAALSMQRRLRELFGDTLALRIGVNTGDVVVGPAREHSSFVTGDTVNVAARLEQAARPGDVLAGERTVTAVRGAFEFGEAQAVAAKGKSQPVPARRVVRALTLMRPRGVVGLGSSFVGRESEVELLQTTYRRAVELRAPHLVTIVGDPGVGKTRLVRELWQWLAGQSPQPHMRTGRLLPYGHATYWALGEILKEHFGILESDPPDVVLGRLHGREILGLALGVDAAAGLHPAAARDRLHEAWVAFLEELVVERPAVVLLEDLHWAEEPVLDLFERALREARGPLLVVATSRPELFDARPQWGSARRNVSTIWLEPLAERDAARMVEGLPPAVGDLVVARAEGNPFFVEELVAALVDRGVLVRNGGWRVTGDDPAAEVPDSVHALLAARIDLLDVHAKSALQAAAVIGRVFWRSPLVALLAGGDPALDILSDRDFVRRGSGSSMEGDVEYSFKHALTREVAYASLPKARRAPLHARFAEWLEELGGGRDEHAALLAHHYYEAVRPEDADLAWGEDVDTQLRLRRSAVRWLHRAGTLALGRYELDDAVALLERALDLEPDEAAAALLWRDLGRAHAFRYDGTAFWDAMERALALIHDRRSQATVLAELAYQTSMRAGMFRTPPEAGLVDGWIDRALELEHDESETRAEALLARVFWSAERNAAAADEALHIAMRLGDARLRSAAARAVGCERLKAGDTDAALTATQRSFDLLGEIADPEEAVEVHEQMVQITAALGRVAEARRLSAVHDGLVQPLSPHHRVHGVALKLELEELVGGWETVRSLRERTERTIAANAGTPCGRHARSFLIQALAHEHLGDGEQARRLERLADEWSAGSFPSGIVALRARLALARGDLDAAGSAVHPSALSKRGWWWWGQTVAIAYLDTRAAIGAGADVEAVAEDYLRGDNRLLRLFALRALGRVRGDPELVRRALAGFESLHLDWYARETRALL